MGSANVMDTTDAAFENDVLESELPVLVEFWAAWALQCVALAPHVGKLADANVGKLKVVRLDTQQNAWNPAMFGLSNLPTLLVFKDGKVVDKRIGIASDMAAMLEKLVTPHI